MKEILIALGCILTFNCPAQSWFRINSLPSVPFITLAKDDMMMYASTDRNEIYVSADQGTTWAPSVLGPATIRITTMELFGHTLYAGTNNSGIFISNDSGRTWVNNGLGLPTVNSFTEWRDKPYAATLGSGFYTLNQAGTDWVPFNNDLPNYSTNVFKVLNTNDTLVGAAGGNGTIYRYNPTTNIWEENYYFGILRPGILVHDLVYSEGTTLAVSGGSNVLRTNNGSTWNYDTVGLVRPDAADAYVSSGAAHFFSVVNDRIGGGSQLYKKEKNLGVGTAWQPEGDRLTTGYTYAVKEFGEKLFLCRTDGLFYNDLITGVNNPPLQHPDVFIYPNPSAGRNVTIKSNEIIKEISIFNMAGALVFQANVQKSEFQLPILPNGMYVARLAMNKVVKSYKILSN